MKSEGKSAKKTVEDLVNLGFVIISAASYVDFSEGQQALPLLKIANSYMGGADSLTFADVTHVRTPKDRREESLKPGMHARTPLGKSTTRCQALLSLPNNTFLLNLGVATAVAHLHCSAHRPCFTVHFPILRKRSFDEDAGKARRTFQKK
jgi:hypothetical protein